MIISAIVSGERRPDSNTSHHQLSQVICLGNMGEENRASLDVFTPPLTPIANTRLENDGKDETVSSAGDDTNLRYTLKPATRAYASTAR